MLRKVVFSLLLITTAAITAAAAPTADGPPVMRVVILDVGKDAAKLPGLLKRAAEVAQKLGDTGKTRYWFNAIAGRDTGAVIVTIEYANMVAFAQAATKMEGSPEWRQFLAEAQTTEIRPISTSVVSELKPGG